MALWCVCLDCGRQFTADRDEKLCPYCWEKDCVTFANVPNEPRPPFVNRWPKRDNGAPPCPLPAVIVPVDVPRVNYQGGPCSNDKSHGGPFVSRIGRKVLCSECARQADRIALGVQRRTA